jgi:murein DD-endopeptidase MepM/ murein hydrolase activator NlpD
MFSEKRNPKMSSSRRIAMAAAGLVVAVALVPASAARAAAPAVMSLVKTNSSMAGHTVTAFVTEADLAVDSSTTAQPGEGVIRITTRVCGSADNWQAVAAANGIMAPVYLVLLGQKLTVACAGAPATDTTAPAPAPAPAPTRTDYTEPTPGSGTSDCYGYYAWRGYVHRGIDFTAGYGAPIHAAHSGQVDAAGWIYSGYGIDVLLHGNDGWWTHYAHMSQLNVTKGQWVNAGDVIGYVGATGQVTGPHLHFEVWQVGYWSGNQQVDPGPWLREHGLSAQGC